jgi:hypothetical protein
MTDNDPLPINGGDTPDDAELAARVARFYQATPGSTAAMAARCARYVLDHAALTAAPPSVFRRPRVWATGLAAVAAVLLVMFGLPVSITPKAAAPVETTPVASASTTPVDNGLAIQFELHLPKDAAKVSVVGDFNGWDTTATPMEQERGKGAWSAKVTLLPGRHVYAYIVNGERWIVDPLAPQVSDADYGPANALVVEGGSR